MPAAIHQLAMHIPWWWLLHIGVSAVITIKALSERNMPAAIKGRQDSSVHHRRA